MASVPVMSSQFVVYVAVLVTVVLLAVCVFFWYLSKQSCRDCKAWQGLMHELEQHVSDWDAISAHPALLEAAEASKPKSRRKRPTKPRATAPAPVTRTRRKRTPPAE